MNVKLAEQITNLAMKNIHSEINLLNDMEQGKYNSFTEEQQKNIFDFIQRCHNHTIDGLLHLSLCKTEQEVYKWRKEWLGKNSMLAKMTKELGKI